MYTNKDIKEILRIKRQRHTKAELKLLKELQRLEKEKQTIAKKKEPAINRQINP